MDLTTSYLGLELKNPIVVASCGLTGNLDSIKNLEKCEAGAVVLKSIFEEEILVEVNQQIREAERDPMIYSALSETLDYIDVHLREKSLSDYLDLIRQVKKEIEIPLIASINCVSFEDWTYFTKRIEEAGADAIELNLFLNPADFQSKEFEQLYFTIIDKVRAETKLPVSIKISRYFTRMGLSVQALSESGVAGMVLFNRFYTPDIDISTLSLKGRLYTEPGDYAETLRWIAIMSNRVGCDLAASGGIHAAEDVIKLLLAGATVTQIASTLYRNGPDQIGRILKQLVKWMEEKEFSSVNDFRGKVTEEYRENPAIFERMQFMKHFSDIR